MQEPAEPGEAGCDVLPHHRSCPQVRTSHYTSVPVSVLGLAGLVIDVHAPCLLTQHILRVPPLGHGWALHTPFHSSLCLHLHLCVIIWHTCVHLCIVCLCVNMWLIHMSICGVCVCAHAPA